MRRALRIVFRVLAALAGLIIVLAVLGVYFVYTPATAMPQLSGTLSKGTIAVRGLQRTYLTYVPRGLARGAPVVMVLHGSGENGARIRSSTGYAFDRLADQHGFAVVYPNAYDGYWDVCSIAGDVNVNGLNIDDVGFLAGLADKLVDEIGIGRDRVFVAGSSRGGSMALRLALEAPSRYRGVAAVSADIPAPENFKCKPAEQGTCSVMIMNGTEDPIVPFNGGPVRLFGFFYKNGNVLSSRASGQYLAARNNISGTPETNKTQLANGIQVEQVLWRNNSRTEVELVVIHGGGHGIPQPYRRRPRILGPSLEEPNGPAVIWSFFERQIGK